MPRSYGLRTVDGISMARQTEQAEVLISITKGLALKSFSVSGIQAFWQPDAPILPEFLSQTPRIHLILNLPVHEEEDQTEQGEQGVDGVQDGNNGTSPVRMQFTERLVQCVGTMPAALTISYDSKPYEEIHTPVLQKLGVMLEELSLSVFGWRFDYTPLGFTQDLEKLRLSCPNLRRLAIRGLHVPDDYFKLPIPSITTLEVDWAFPDEEHELAGAPFSALLAHLSTASLQRLVIWQSDDTWIETWQW